ncbi:hypothetical protein BAE44_0023669 [Dichanthelium oligosanthes]|uniref:Pectinesterase inhibitor domain-containing protein n=1 Tax=Dichanthelium oligosanthes TaxID=888268 RepID=A0A1E5UQY9_9POAL|nr:hypothetical protein BAE44_0023669 [Dichanthelium oligosanthes]
MNKIDMMLKAGNLPAGKEREAIGHCKEKYGEAGSQMASGADHLSGGDFKHTRQEYLDRLHDSFQSLPLYAVVAADFALTGVANDLLEAFTNVGWEIPSKEMNAVSHCKEKYEEAETQISTGSANLVTCDFRNARKVYVTALSCIRSCLDRLHDFQSSPLYGMVAADFALTRITCDLDGLVKFYD